MVSERHFRYAAREYNCREINRDNRTTSGKGSTLLFLFASEVHALGGAAQQGGEAAGSPLMNMLPFILMFVIMYFLLIRPQYKKQKETQTMIDALKKGDRVVTTGGMHGSIVGIKDKEGIIVLQVAKEVKIEVSRGAVSKVVDKKES